MGRKTDIKINKSHVHIEVEDIAECCFELWDVAGEQNSVVRVKIPIKDWKKIVKKWDIEAKKLK